MTTEDQNIENTKLAYTIIQSLLDGNEKLNDLLAVMAHALDRDVAKALTNTNEWEHFLESRRNLETTKTQIEEFTERVKKMENG